MMCPHAIFRGDGCRPGSQLTETDTCDAQVANIAAVAIMFPGALFAMAAGEQLSAVAETLHNSSVCCA